MAFGPAAMGYDRAITIFSPDGDLYQVDYAFQAVKKGWTTLGVKTKKAVVIAGEKKRSMLVDIDSVEKIFLIDDHVGCSFAGLASDGRILIDYARNSSLQHRLVYDEPISIDYLTKLVADVKQAYTQHGGVRPFGVSLIIGGVDKGVPKLFMTEPSGQYMPYLAVAIGENYTTATEYLQKNYKDDLDVEDTIALAINALRSSRQGGEKIGPSEVEIGYAAADTGIFRKLSLEERAQILQKLG
ncbi:MAG: proteasome subunit alpha [Candidatus Aramenus sulfurataquae]|uniref:Proteasome subunit alpha n=2 Tax=Candidatus Aramenus sulfurataquae TaxID=1326980 RepID=W7KX86_9CREN|nr:MAG: proteasome subunit alpha [Candidatus Aramenus sulfurataquae]MBW9140569.1 archaeal proteasome endopeptidase complex subunit alpha [Candidatus Aramenus sp.]MCL7343333.1 archaeal proteasome endopeptidase complex subunit alpha [Candidatus Aramenus sulfurataquae]